MIFSVNVSCFRYVGEKERYHGALIDSKTNVRMLANTLTPVLRVAGPAFFVAIQGSR